MIYQKIISLLSLVSLSMAAGLASPIAPIPDARIGVGITYGMDGFNLYDSEIEAGATLSSIQATVAYAPVTNINLGIDLGVTSVSVKTEETAKDFSGDFGFSGGANAKLSSNFINDRVAFTGILKGGWFYSSTDEDYYYRGVTLSGSLGPTFHINNFGYLGFGYKYFEINGENEGSGNVSSYWGNDQTMGGYLSVDYFPKSEVISSYIPYISFVVDVFPEAGLQKNDIALHNISFSISFGAITNRLYGKKSEVNWRP